MRAVLAVRAGTNERFLLGDAGEKESAAGVEKEAIRAAVASRIDTLDEAFLITLMGFVQASEAEGDAGMAGPPHAPKRFF